MTHLSYFNISIFVRVFCFLFFWGFLPLVFSHQNKEYQNREILGCQSTRIRRNSCFDILTVGPEGEKNNIALFRSVPGLSTQLVMLCSQMVVFQTKAHLYHNLEKPKAEVLRYQQGLEIVLHARKMCRILAQLPRIPVQSVQGEALRHVFNKSM